MVSKQIMKVNIPIPCSEKYNAMSPSELGRMCKVCNTEVVDFTDWKTKDIIDYIEKSNKKNCGKLSISNKKPHINKSKNFGKYIAATLVAICSATPVAFAHPLSKTQTLIQNHASSIQDSITIEFIDSQNNSLPYVNLTNTKTNQKFTTDNRGRIKFPISGDLEFRIVYLGFLTQEIKIDKKHINSPLRIILKEDKSDIIGELIITNKYSLRQKIKRLFNIFSVKDEE